ncbi:hypothetical protein [Streptomyces griseus]|uniref:hypothetical protein n=1 Tax=Streptomyces griseus TaxID=1911 RepID=UPI0004C6020F|nr:hypothetical protein [Streptomyces griseus]
MTRYQIEAPVRSFSGESAGVQFSKGTGYVTDATKPGRAALEYFRRHGYGVAPADEDTVEERVQALVAGAQSTAPYDPAEHSVEDVLTYLAGVEHDEATRVLDAEMSAKKPRVGITSKRDEILAATAPAAPAGDDTKGPKA